MVRATVIISAVFALAASVSAIPTGQLINVDGGHHIGLNDVNAQELGQEFVDARGFTLKDAVQRIAIADGHHLLKREETPAGTLRIARAAGSKKNMAKKDATAA
jgi:hypothetical protein